jgi:hypothetical protein
MAETYKKISDFNVAASLGDNDLLLVSQSGTTKVIKGSMLKALAKAAGVEAAKINNATVNALGHLVITTTDGTVIDTGKVTGADGVSVAGASIDAQYHLILTFSDGSTKDAGYCRGASGAGTGDMLASDYDSDNAVKAAGGIAEYVKNNIPIASKSIRGGVKIKTVTKTITPSEWVAAGNGAYYSASVPLGSSLMASAYASAYDGSLRANQFSFATYNNTTVVRYTGEKPTGNVTVTVDVLY